MNKIDILFEKLADIEKKAYPNYVYEEARSSYDLNKWVLSMQKIIHMQKSGMDKFSAVDKITSGWSSSEIDGFLNWMKYYESGELMKYKYASLYSSNPGYYLHMDSNKADFTSDEVEEPEEDNKEERLYSFKKKFISRLNSLEKLLGSSDGQDFLRKDSDELINIIFDLKKKITKLKVASFYSIHDEIIRYSKTNKNQIEFLEKLAQNAAPPPAQPPAPNQPMGSATGLPAMGVGNSPPPNNPPIPDLPDDINGTPAPTPEENEVGQKDKGANDFVSKFIGKDDNKSDDVKEEDYLFVSEAQQADIPPPNTGGVQPQKPDYLKNDYDASIDNLFKNVKVEDVIVKLDSLSNIFKEREIPRQLAIIDMMLNALNLSQMFPGLSESHNKALESNNYILTRIDDISSKLRGSIKGTPLDLTPRENTSADPKAAIIKDTIKKEEEADKKRKELRKQVENEAMDKMKETPSIEVSDTPEPSTITEQPVANTQQPKPNTVKV